jgi:hypothetical protein
MRKAWNILFFAFFVLCLFLFRPRQDVVFAAVDKSQYIRLFEKGMDFELCVEENSTFTGTYTILKDTVYLSYREQPILSANIASSDQKDFRKILPRKLYINTGASNIEASDGNIFSAKIYLDMRKKQYNGPIYSITVLKNQEAQISGIRSKI